MNEATTLDIWRPLGAGAATTTGIVCRFTNQFSRAVSTCPLNFTHAVEVPGDTDIRDGCTRTNNAITWGDGDEVRIAALNSSTRFVVVWVDHIITPPGHPAKKIAYLLRHAAAWPGP